MPLLLIFVCVALIICITFNSFSYLDWKKMSETALRVYRDDRRSMKILCTCLKALSILIVIADIVLFACAVLNVNQSLAILALALVCALFGFVPPSSSLWLITEKGVYCATKRITLTWNDLIKIGKKAKKSRTQLTLQVKKGRGEMFKTVYYVVHVSTTKADEAAQIMHDFLDARDRAVYMHRQKRDQQKDVNERKFY